MAGSLSLDKNLNFLVSFNKIGSCGYSSHGSFDIGLWKGGHTNTRRCHQYQSTTN